MTLSVTPINVKAQGGLNWPRTNPTVAGEPQVLFGGKITFEPRPHTKVVTITDFRDGTSNAQVTQRFDQAFNFVLDRRGKKAPYDTLIPDTPSAVPVPRLLSVADVPLFNRDAQAVSLLRLGEEPNRDVFIHVTDPGVHGVGDSHLGDGAATSIPGNQRSVLLTQNHGVFVGPNNGSLGLLGQFLKQHGEPHELREIDLPKVAALEKARLGKQSLVATFNGRDVFAPVAAWLLRGLSVDAFTKPEPIEIVLPKFAEEAHLPSKVGETTHAVAIVDNTSGNLKTNIALTQDEFDRLARQNQWLKINNPESGLEATVPIKHTFAEVGLNQPLVYLGSTFAPDGKRQYVEVALNQGNFGELLKVAQTHGARELALTRVAQPATRPLSVVA